MVADVDGDDGVGRAVLGQRGEDGGRRHAPAAVVGRRRAFSARQIAQRAATSGRWSTAVASRRAAAVQRRAA